MKPVDTYKFIAPQFTEDQLREASSILRRVVTDQKIKLAFGVRQRAENREALERGENPNNYRIDWLRASRSRIVQTLRDMAGEFNAKHPHDCISVMDLMDVLASTQLQFQQAVQQKENPEG